jgi:hypothetical protein
MELKSKCLGREREKELKEEEEREVTVHNITILTTLRRDSVLLRFKESDADYAYVAVSSLGAHTEQIKQIAGNCEHGEGPIQRFCWQISVY